MVCKHVIQWDQSIWNIMEITIIIFYSLTIIYFTQTIVDACCNLAMNSLKCLGNNKRFKDYKLQFAHIEVHGFGIEAQQQRRSNA